MKPLAIIIPAYKSKFLVKTLNSFVQQKNKNFKIYVGDDCSPEDIENIVRDFQDKLDVKYYRYDNNIGAKDLVKHWNRCLKLIGDEEWVWIFSDDDIVDRNCVEIFYKTIEEDNNQFNVYRFNTRVINDKDEIISESIESPYIDSSENMAIDILLGNRGNSMPDHIFRVETVKKNGGFIYTEYAQAADWASSIFYSFDRGIKTMQGAKVNWRLGNYNISGNANKNKYSMLNGHLRFLSWVYVFFLQKKDFDRERELKDAIIYNLEWVIKYHYKGIDIRSFPKLLFFYRSFDLTLLTAFKKLIYLYKYS